MIPTKFADLRLIEVNDEALLREIFGLRIRSWKRFVDIDPAYTEWSDEFESVSQHWAILDGATPIAAARLTISNDVSGVPDAAFYTELLGDRLSGPIGSFNRLCVSPAYRGRNLSIRLDEARLAAARARGCRSIVLRTSAGHRRIAQLESLGFQNIGVGRQDTKGPLVAATLPNVLFLELHNLGFPG